MNIIDILLIVLGVLTVFIAIIFVRDLIKNRDKIEKKSWVIQAIIGFFTNFFDALGIGSFATGTAAFKIFNQVEDRFIPGTLNVGFAIPVIMEAFIFIEAVEVDPLTLIAMIVAAVLGAWIGAGIVSGLPERKIQIGMAVALFFTGLIRLASKFGLLPAGGDAIGLQGVQLIFAVAVNFILGALMTLGIGLYAPAMALVFALGMSPIVAFPIMFGSCAFLMPVAAVKFIKNGAYNRQASICLTVFGVAGIWLATSLVKNMDVSLLLWIVIAVVFYTSISMYLSAKKSAKVQAEVANGVQS